MDDLTKEEKETIAQEIIDFRKSLLVLREKFKKRAPQLKSFIGAYALQSGFFMDKLLSSLAELDDALKGVYDDKAS